MEMIVFAIALLAALAVAILSLTTLLTEKAPFWPPPHIKSWQYHLFWILFRVMFGGIIILSVLDFNSLPMFDSRWRHFVGILLTVLGFGFAFYITFSLGWKNAHGEREGLKTDGWYKFSRNPVYVVSILGFLGLGITVNSGFVYPLLFLWTLFYLLAPFLEEPWLEEQYGEAYLEYKSKVPRFIRCDLSS